MKFSIWYETFEEWLAAHPEDSAYKNRIVRCHEEYPGATLTDLAERSTYQMMYKDLDRLDKEINRCDDATKRDELYLEFSIKNELICGWVDESMFRSYLRKYRELENEKKYFEEKLEHCSHLGERSEIIDRIRAIEKEMEGLPH